MNAAQTLADFDAELAALNLHGQWNSEAYLAKLTDGPIPAGTLMTWTWATVYEKLLESCEIFPESLLARRNFTYVTPGLPRRGTTPTLIMGPQLVLPGEVAWAHRHSIGALRFVIDGSPQLSTVVNGVALAMESYDLVLTPAWTWHEHHNESAEKGIWLDVLDVPLVMGLNQTFYEPFGDSVQPRREPDAESAGWRFPWRETEPLLRANGGQRYEYRNPATGGSVLPTMAAYAQLFAAGAQTAPQRQTASTVYHVVAGSGATVIDGHTLEWSARDSFAVPAWSRHHHVNRSSRAEAILFSVSDEPLLRALGLFKEEPAKRSER